MIVVLMLGVIVDCYCGQDQSEVQQEFPSESASMIAPEEVNPVGNDDVSEGPKTEVSSENHAQVMHNDDLPVALNGPENENKKDSQPEQKIASPQQSEFENQSQAVTSPATNTVVGDEDLSTIEGIDNVNIDEPQGNWLFKRIWWERAEALCDKIKKTIEEIFEQRMIFFTKRSELDKDVLDPFYLTIGMGQGEFKATLDELLSSLEKEKDKKGFLSAGEREIVNLLESEQKTLEQLSLDLHTINQLEQQLDTSLAQLVDHMLDIRVYDRQAWDAFKEIARVIDDQEARRLYYAVDTAAHNIKDIGDYLGNAFYAHFDQLISTIREQTEKMTLTVKALREKGIDFKKQVEFLTAPRPAPEKAHDVAEKDEGEQESQGFFATYFINPLKMVYDTVVWGVLWPYHAIFGTSEEDESSEE